MSFRNDCKGKRKRFEFEQTVAITLTQVPARMLTLPNVTASVKQNLKEVWRAIFVHLFYKYQFKRVLSDLYIALPLHHSLHTT